MPRSDAADVAAPRLALYLDDPPIAADSDGRGLNQVNARIAGILAPDGPTVINLMRLQPGQTIAPPAAGSEAIAILDGWRGLAVRAMGRVSSAARSLFEGRLIGRLGAADPFPGILFAPLGGDLGAFDRAHRVADRLGARLVAYLVDDPLDNCRRLTGWDAFTHPAGRRLTGLLARCSAVFGISEQLCALLDAEHGTSSRVLALPYQRNPQIVSRTIKNQIIYVGHINQIYGSELRYWIETLRRAGFFAEGRLVVTGRMEPAEGVDYRSFATTAELCQEIADSRACLLPISSRESNLCFSSFPSKLLDYLGYGRLILASAPPTSVAAEFFRTHHLPLCFDEQAIDTVTLNAALASDRDEGALYRQVLDEVASAAEFRAAIHSVAVPSAGAGQDLR